MKTQHCDECEYRKWTVGSNLVCQKGHKPRFYKPVYGKTYLENWGWKRRCSDFVLGEHVQMLTPNVTLGK